MKKSYLKCTEESVLVKRNGRWVILISRRKSWFGQKTFDEAALDHITGASVRAPKLLA